MHVARKDDGQEAPATNPLMIGEVRMRALVPASVSPDVTVSIVRFLNGARNKRHVHSASQVLYITEGDGIVADDEAELHVSAGDIVHVAAGKVHWHGAQPGKDMAHLTITPPCTTEAVE